MSTPTTQDLERFADWCATPVGQLEIQRFGWREGAHYCRDRGFAVQTGYKVHSGDGPTLFEHYSACIAYYLRPARYAKGKIAISCTSSSDGFMTRACRLASCIARRRYTNRENAYILSQAAAARFERLYRDGWDANTFTDALVEPTNGQQSA
jgi:hypothetical protein